MTLILDGMCERLIFPDISKGRTEDCSEAPGQNSLCYRESVEDRLKCMSGGSVNAFHWDKLVPSLA